MIADYYWLQLIGYVGDIEERKLDRYCRANEYIELITSLDPHFISPYWFAAFVIGGDSGQPSKASAILDRGIEQNPNSWHLPFIAGINQYLYAKNEIRAAKYYRMAAKFPDAPMWLERQATIFESSAPTNVKEGYSWLSIYKSADSSQVKDRAKERCIWLWIQVFKTAPNDVYRNKAREVLKEFNVDVDGLALNQ